MSLVFLHVQKRPEAGRGRREFDIELINNRASHRDFHAHRSGAILHGKVQISLFDLHLPRGRPDLPFAIALHNLVHIDVPPTSLPLVDNLNHGLLAGRSCTSQEYQSSRSLPPGRSLGPVAVRTTCPSTSRLMQASPGYLAAAEQEVDVAAFDDQWRAGQRAGRAVAFVVTVDQSFSLRSRSRPFGWGACRARSGPERRAGRRPVAIVLAFKIRDEHIGLVGHTSRPLTRDTTTAHINRPRMVVAPLADGRNVGFRAAKAGPFAERKTTMPLTYALAASYSSPPRDAIGVEPKLDGLPGGQ